MVHHLLVAGAGEAAARGLSQARKDNMAEAAAGLLAGSAWVPRLLRAPAIPAEGGEAMTRVAAE
ncbi:hypothetical protein ACLF3G_27655 [Falsiroseomonas sp. HC035]|uniref:hypothetical protein n=1 Tax=Falsiroseomonas sp. HC035 TaxID=3390999 RepID=UPI003D31E4C5